MTADEREGPWEQTQTTRKEVAAVECEKWCGSTGTTIIVGIDLYPY
jgi:hypothetical protein